MASAPATLAVEDSPQTANRDRRRKRRRDNRCFAISAASAPPPCNTSYCCGVIGGVSILMVSVNAPVDTVLVVVHTLAAGSGAVSHLLDRFLVAARVPDTPGHTC